MLRIACCDDVIDDRNAVMYTLTRIEESIGTEFEISFFNCGEDLCESLKTNSYDVILAINTITFIIIFISYKISAYIFSLVP